METYKKEFMVFHSQKQLKPEAHAMNKTITQDTQNDNQISKKKLKGFFIEKDWRKIKWNGKI